MTDNFENDEKLISKMKESLDYLDSSVEVKKPELMQLFDLVNTVEEKKAVSKNRQFITFISTALLAICIETYSFHRSIIFFALVQVIALAGAIPAIILLTRKGKRQVSS